MGKSRLNVRLLSCTKEPIVTIALSGKLCYSPSGIGELKQSVQSGSPEAFLDKLLDSGHLSPIEHASFTFGIEGVSRALLAQITRHRIASFSVQSQRYVKMDEFNYIVPPSIGTLGEEAEREYGRQMRLMHEWYLEWMKKTGAAEDARFVLPNAAETRFIVTMNARELLHFFNLRCCNRAQWEIRKLAFAMLALARREAPALFCEAGSSCISGSCPEGRMSCGKKAEMQQASKKLNELLSNGATDEELMEWAIDFA
ncbi:MAG: Thymidylate synthase ThyX [Firmicutes bacterium ADurb.Bin182]|nr:MAG: Thymidylate synthase ThyX [Firmicutes bacterium ADurb.Bin182]